MPSSVLDEKASAMPWLFVETQLKSPHVDVAIKTRFVNVLAFSE